ncbi:MAG: hypothetical protein NTX25_04215, partial [Proteobacteria bacterium]|nr:hypothetical protein [Pseudomonadota bacterium]
LLIFAQRFHTLTPRHRESLSHMQWLWILGLGLNTLIFAVLLFSFSWEAWALYSSLYSYLFLACLLFMTIAYTQVRIWGKR